MGASDGVKWIGRYYRHAATATRLSRDLADAPRELFLTRHSFCAICRQYAILRIHSFNEGMKRRMCTRFDICMETTALHAYK